MSKCSNPTPTPPRILKLRKDYLLPCSKLHAAIGSADPFEDAIKRIDECIYLGARFGVKMAQYAEKHNIKCACKIPEDVRLQMMEQLSGVVRETIEKWKIPLPPEATDPLKASDFWMAFVDHLEDAAHFFFRNAKQDGGLVLLKVLATIERARIAEGEEPVKFDNDGD